MKKFLLYTAAQVIIILSFIGLSFKSADKQTATICVPVNHVQVYCKKYYGSGFTLKFCVPTRSRVRTFYLHNGMNVSPTTDVEMLLLIFEK